MDPVAVVPDDLLEQPDQGLTDHVVTPPRGTVETAFDGERWYNRVLGTRVVANFRGTRAEAEMKGRAMAQARSAHHIVRDQHGKVVSHTEH
jgi:hypothetical protein